MDGRSLKNGFSQTAFPKIPPSLFAASVCRRYRCVFSGARLCHKSLGRCTAGHCMRRNRLLRSAARRHRWRDSLGRYARRGCLRPNRLCRYSAWRRHPTRSWCGRGRSRRRPRRRRRRPGPQNNHGIALRTAHIQHRLAPQNRQWNPHRRMALIADHADRVSGRRCKRRIRPRAGLAHRQRHRIRSQPRGIRCAASRLCAHREAHSLPPALPPRWEPSAASRQP